MQNVQQAMADLGKALGMSELKLSDGNATLIYDKKIPINIAEIDERTVEFWTPLRQFGSAGQVETLKHALTANHLGEGTGGGRIALQPDGGGFILCERIDVAGLDQSALQSRFGDFVRYAQFWNAPESRSARPDDAQVPSSDESAFVLRV